jgi:hypothetical protein
LVLGILGKEGCTLLSRKLWLPLFGALLIASSASAVSKTFTMIAGSNMTTTNDGGVHVVPVTGSVTLDDDGLGTLTITDISLSHVGNEVGLPPFISVIITRPAINLGAGPVAGSGSFLGGASFGSTDIAQPGGTVLCTDGFILCSAQGLPSGIPVPLPTPLTGVALGNWTILNSLLTASFQYGPTVSNSTDVLTLVAVPEPGTALLLAGGLLGMALRRRAVR